MQQRLLPSERVVLSAPTSFSGSARRIWKITEGRESLWTKAASVTVALLLIAVAWCLVAVWYCLCLLFFIPFIIFRLFRRSARKDKAAQLRHREVMARLEQPQVSGRIDQAEKTPQA